MKYLNFKILFASVLMAFLLGASPALALNTMLSYTSYPPVVSEPTTPNVLLLISNDHSGFYRGYGDLDAYDNTINYYGYFDPLKYYSYKAGSFNPEGYAPDHYVPAGSTSYWSGNFLNWLTMSHADFLRKALTGGRRSVDATAVGATTLERADVPKDGAHDWKKTYKGADLGKLVPPTYANTTYTFYNYGTVFDVINSKSASVTKGRPFSVEVSVCALSMEEDNCQLYPNGNQKPVGLLQKYMDQMRFGLMTYSHANPDSGGVLRMQMRDIHDLINWASNGSETSAADSMIRYINGYTVKGWDPLGEMYYDAVRYIRGNQTGQAAYCSDGTLQTDDGFAVFGCKSNKLWEDPVLTWCQKNNILIINDEYPSRDSDAVPGTAFANYSDTPVAGAVNKPYNPDVRAIAKMIGDNEGITGTKQLFADDVNAPAFSCATKKLTSLGDIRGICESEPTSQGTYYLASLAYDAFVNDQRDDLEKLQNIRTWTIAFRSAPDSIVGYKVPKAPLNQMWLAAKYGNFDDRNGNKIPDLPEEWMNNPSACTTLNDMENDSCHPKAFWYAESGEDISNAILKALDSILQRAASGTAVSVLATSGQGEGNLVQAYYRPKISQDDREITWTGYLQSLWVDKYGYIREDTNGNLKLDEDADNVLKYFLDADGTTRVRVYPVDSLNMFPDLVADIGTSSVIEMGAVKVVWEGGQRLADMDAADRNIFTYLDKDNDELVDGGEVVKFNVGNLTGIAPYLSLQDTAADVTTDLGKTELDRAQNLIEFIRGRDPTVDADKPYFRGADSVVARDRILAGQVWKLGDIIQSTPVSISSPPDRFDIIYSDQTYADYYAAYKDRETMVYVGANDGMLHAFSSWTFDSTLQAFIRPAAAPVSELVGSEVWAYIPQNLLPHLRWLAREDYTHVHYMDLQPRIFDARIFDPADPVHVNGWGTILVAGMNFGGGMHTVTGDFGSGIEIRSFKPGYVCMDVTDPRNPVLLWERSYDDLGFSRAIPTPLRIGAKPPIMKPDAAYDPANSGWFLTFGSGPDAGDVGGATRYKGESDINAHFYVVDLKTGQPYTNGAKDWLFESTETNAFTASPSAYDRKLNYNTDAAYFGTTYDNDPDNAGAAVNDWKGSFYRILTVDPLAAPGTDTYTADPTQWSMIRLFDAPRPITAPGVLSIDHLGNTWAYFGTGRYLSKGVDSDEVSTDQEYLFGIKDPFFDRYSAHYQQVSDVYTLTTADLLYSSPFLILQSGQVLWWNGASYTNPYGDVDPWYWNDLVFHARSKQGWYRTLSVGATAERSLNKPAVIGGLSLFTTFSPKGDVCDYGGNSSLWALYYETGTAYKNPVFRDGFGLKEVIIAGSPQTAVRESFSLGSGTTSSVGVHIGKQNDRADNISGDLATGFVQQGTGTVIDFEFETALKIRSGLRSWLEQ